jgi:SAM-dependent methyltransferase
MARPDRFKPRRPTSATGNRAPQRATSWEKSAEWYDRLIGERGSDLYRRVVIPSALNLLSPQPDETLLDLGCGQGVFSRAVAAKGAVVTGVDAAPSLIHAARKYRQPQRIRYETRDAADLKGLGTFQAVSAILCVQNMAHLDKVTAAAASALNPGGRMLWVLNHPCFRIPRQSAWGFDEGRKIQYRRVDRYASPLEIPITMHPGRNTSEETLSFHRSLETLLKSGFKAGLSLSGLEEWTSHKTSAPGPRARAENRARSEIPLFLALLWVRPTT